MRKLNFLAVTVIAMAGITFASCDSRQTAPLKTDIDSVSFLIGSSYGAGLKENFKSVPGPAINIEALIDGFIKGTEGDSLFLGMDMQTMGMYVQSYFQNIETQVAEEAKAESATFFAENKTKSGVITTESGLQYQVITEGTGPKPTLASVVKVHYHGTLLNGEVFDSSIERGEPAEFQLGGVIPGWSEGVQLMPVGSKYKFWVPIELAYYNQTGHPYNNKPLVFEVELLEIVSN